MATVLESLEKEVMHFPEDQRVTLAHRILLSKEPVDDRAVGALWETESVCRIVLRCRGATERNRAFDVVAKYRLNILATRCIAFLDERILL